MLLVMIKECTRVPCLQKGASRNSFNAKNFYSWQQVEVPNLFLWVSVTILDSFFPFVNNPRSILLNKWTSAFLLQNEIMRMMKLIQWSLPFITESLSYLSGVIVFLWPRKRRWPSTALAMFPEYEGIKTSLSTDTM